MKGLVMLEWQKVSNECDSGDSPSGLDVGDHLSAPLLCICDRVAAHLGCRHLSTLLHPSKPHLLQQSPGLEEAEAGVAGVEVEAQRGVQAPPAGAVSQGSGQLARGPGH